MAPHAMSSPRCPSPSSGASLTELEGKASIMETSPEKDSLKPLAIVGFSLHLPGRATDSRSFWNVLLESKCVVEEFPPGRFDMQALHHPDKNRATSLTVRGASFLSEDVTAFDNSFFSISASEAAVMDPQQRLLLELTYQALENSGITLDEVDGSPTSVYVGNFVDDYKSLYFKDPGYVSNHASIGLARSMYANRISWAFNALGPSVTVDTACSSSLVALDLACQSLRSGDCEMSIVAGCNLLLAPDYFFVLSQAGFLSSDGRCRSFDARGEGYGRGEGIGVIIIKPLDLAVAHGDTIRAVIRSTGSNQDGHTPGITQPSSSSQESLIRECYRKATLDPSRTTYVEAHGPGTPIGDPIEANALGAFFRHQRPADQPLYVGSVKSNIGHLEGASGVAGIIKSILMLESGIIPGIAGLDEVNPKIDAEHLRLQFPKVTVPWPHNGLRRISVNSFGFGGSNAHVILDDAFNFLREHRIPGKSATRSIPPLLYEKDSRCSPSILPSPAFAGDENYNEIARYNDRKVMLALSAADEKGIERLARALDEYLDGVIAECLNIDRLSRDLAFTLACRRTTLPWKAFFMLNSSNIKQTQRLVKQIPIPQKSIVPPRLAFVFSGQGAQWPRMGKELMAFDVFRQSLRSSEAILQSLGCEWLLTEELDRTANTSRISEPEISQPACTAIQIALVDLLESLAVRPHGVIGHSSGEIAAAYACGAICHRSAMKIAFFRGLLTAKATRNADTPGAMLSVGMSADDMSKFLQDEWRLNLSVTIACYNSPVNVTMSGDKVSISTLQQIFEKSVVFARELRTGAAYHSHHMESISREYASRIVDLNPREGYSGQVRMFSTVSGKQIPPKALRNAPYWSSNLVSPVQFEAAYRQLCQTTKFKRLDRSHLDYLNIDACVEIGPHAVLHTPMKDILGDMSREMVLLTALQRHQDAFDNIFKLIGELWAHGYPADLQKLNFGERPINDFSCLNELPYYPFDHSRSFYHEGRLSKNSRSARHPKNDLLGDRVLDWNPTEARWSNFVKLSELPWVEDHKVNTSVIYPAAGMLVMAIEAIKQLQRPDAHVDGFDIREFLVHTALVVPDDDVGVEVQFYLHSKESAIQATSWSDFRLYSVADGNWNEICTGQIRVTGTNKPTVNDVSTSPSLLSRLTTLHRETQTAAVGPVCMDKLYRMLREDGLDFGPRFRTITSAYYANDYVTAIVKVHSDETYNAKPYEQSHTIHPCTFDALFHLPTVPSTKGGTQKVPAMVVSGVDRLWVSSSGLSQSTASKLAASSRIINMRGRSTRADSFAMDEARTVVLIRMEGLWSTSVDQSIQDSEPLDSNHNLWNLRWRPDIDVNSPSDLQTVCEVSSGCTDGLREFFRRLAFLQFASLKSLTESLSNHEGSSVPRHLRSYFHWAKHQLEGFRTGRLKFWDSSWEVLAARQDHVAREASWLSQQNDEGRIHVAVHQNLHQIFHAEVDALELLFSTSLSERLYAEVCAKTDCFRALHRWLKLFAFKTPNARYLEIGAGTGGSTVPILEALVDGDNPQTRLGLYSQYTFSDISESFFETAREKLSTYPNIRFQKLDIEDAISKQDVKAGNFDIAIAANVLHATKNIKHTLRNVYESLAPGGRLILFEVTNPELGRSGFVFGLLPGWWLSKEEDRSYSPCMTVYQWDTYLKEAGFLGAEVVFQDYKDEYLQEFSIIIATKAPPECSTQKPRLAVTLADSSISAQTSSKEITQFLVSRNINLQQFRFDEEMMPVGTAADERVLVVNDLQAPLLDRLEPELFENVKYFIQRYKVIIWLTRTTSDGQSLPHYAMIDGFSRSCRMESEDMKFVTVGLDNKGELDDVQLNKLLLIMRSTIASKGQYEMAFEEKSGIYHISRLMLDFDGQESFHHNSLDEETRELPLSEAPSLKVVSKFPGSLDSLELVESELLPPSITPDEVEVRVRAVGLNFKDCLVALGSVPGDSLGHECTGIVSKVGQTCQDLNVGDRVCLITSGTLRSVLRIKHQQVCKIPASINLSQSAAFPVVFLTAWISLYETARLRKGESVLIHAGAGGTGQAAIQTAQYLGARVFTTVGSQQKKSLLMREYGLSENDILFSRDLSFKDHIKTATSGRGVDVILNCLAGDHLLASWDCIADFGRFVEIGKKDILAKEKLPMLPFDRAVSYSAIDASLFAARKPERTRAYLETIFDLIEIGVFRPSTPLKVVGVSLICQAFKDLADGQTAGKTVLEMTPDTKVSTTWRCLPGATYVVAGGFGGNGKSIVRWLARLGARYIIILSRSGPRTQGAHDLVKEFQDKNIVVRTPLCDISDASSLRLALVAESGTMPPIRGCIQTAMVLEDSMIPNMHFSQWKAVTDPKVAGSWNLHEALPSGMDFFVLLSSISGLAGQHGQANYAAGNTFQDALARYRISIGEKAVSIDLGVMLEDGYLAENADVMQRLLDQGIMLPVTRNNLFAMLEYYCDPSLPILSIDRCQIVIGINTPANVRARRLEWPRYLQQHIYGALYRVRDGEHHNSPGNETNETGQTDFRRQFLEAGSNTEAAAVAAGAVFAKLTRMLSNVTGDMDAGQPLTSYGLDSLMSIELRSWILRSFQADVAMFEILGGTSLAALGAKIAACSRLRASDVQKKSAADDI